MLFVEGNIITITFPDGSSFETVKVLHHDRQTHWIRIALAEVEPWINLRYVGQIIEHEDDD